MFPKTGTSPYMEEAMAKSELFVTNRPNGWAVVKPNAERATAVFPTQAEAIEHARNIANGGTIHIQGRHGSFRPETPFDE
jgi:hypothetical protein